MSRTNTITALIGAVRQKNLHEASELFDRIMREKVSRRLVEEQDHLNEAGPEHCEFCGSTKDIRHAEDGTPICKDCDVEEGHDIKESFKSVENKISSKEHISKDRAAAILAASSRNASAAAKRKNPNLKKVKG